MVSLPGPAVNPFPPEFNRPPEAKTHTGSINVNHGREGPLSIDDESLRRERKEQSNKKIASQKAISVILRREATMAVIEKKKGSTRLFPGTVLEALHERITALRWESALKVILKFSILIFYIRDKKGYVLNQDKHR